MKNRFIDSTDYPSGSVSYFVGGGHTGFNQDGGKQAPAQYQFVEMEDAFYSLFGRRIFGRTLEMELEKFFSNR